MLARRDALNELELAFHAKTGNFDEMIYAMAFICTLPIDTVKYAVFARNIDLLLLLCRALNLAHYTVNSIISRRALCIGKTRDKMDYVDIEFVRDWYNCRLREKAERILRFVRLRLMSK